MRPPLTHAEAVERIADRSMFEHSRWAYVSDLLASLPEGALAEFGTHRCGFAAYLALRFPSRVVFACDTFDRGVLGANEADGLANGIMKHPFAEVRNWLFDVLGPEHKVTLVTGDLRYDFPRNLPPLAFALVDLNIYAPTLAVLKRLPPFMADGSRILVDDVGFPGVDKALADSSLPWTKQGFFAEIVMNKP